jgi:hypothetical protein
VDPLGQRRHGGLDRWSMAARRGHDGGDTTGSAVLLALTWVGVSGVRHRVGI